MAKYDEKDLDADLTSYLKMIDQLSYDVNSCHISSIDQSSQNPSEKFGRQRLTTENIWRAESPFTWSGVNKHRGYHVPSLIRTEDNLSGGNKEQVYSNENNENRVLLMENLDEWTTEYDVRYHFDCHAQVLSVKFSRNPNTHNLEALAEFADHTTAKKVFMACKGKMFRTLWSTFDQKDCVLLRGLHLKWAPISENVSREIVFSLYIWNLSPDVTDDILRETFRRQYSSVRWARVFTARQSRNCGTVGFGDASEHRRAAVEMQGVFCSALPMYMSPDLRTMERSFGPPLSSGEFFGHNIVPLSKIDSKPATILVCLNQSMLEELLWHVFNRYVGIRNIKVVAGEVSVLVQFDTFDSTERTFTALRQTQIGSNITILSTGITVNMCTNVYEYLLKQVFGIYGELVHVEVPAGKVIGWVQFASHTSANKALLELQRTRLGTSIIRCPCGCAGTSNEQRQRHGSTQNRKVRYGNPNLC